MTPSGMIFLMLIAIIVIGVGIASSFTCARHTFKTGTTGWQKFAAVFVFIQIGFTVLSFIANMFGG
jgi:hypothetical protein